MNINTPPMAMLREHLGRCRWLVVGLAIDFAAMALMVHAFPSRWLSHPGAQAIAFLFSVGFFIGIVALFSADAARSKPGRGGFPSRMFLLPISTARLVAWPMLFGMSAIALGWLATATMILPRLGFHPPLALGAVAAAAAMACFQTLGWWPFATTLGMLLAASLALLALIPPIIWPVAVWERGQAAAWAFLAIYIVSAYLIAVRGVAIDRRGDGRSGGWKSVFEWFDRLGERVARPRQPFASASRAQAWFEWRTKGVFLFSLVALLTTLIGLIVMLLPLIERRDLAPTQAVGLILLTAAMSLMLCLIFGGSFARDEMSGGMATLSDFIATRPLTSGSLAMIRVRAAATGMLAAYGFVVVTLPLWLLATNDASLLVARLRTAIEARGALAVGSALALGALVVVVFTWKGMVGGMVTIFTGRPWITNGLGFLFTAAFLVVGAVVLWLGGDPEKPLTNYVPALLTALPWVLATVLILKVVAGAIVFRLALKRGMFSRRGFAVCASIAVVAAASFFGLGAILLRPSEASVWVTLAIAAAVFPPWGRLAAAPLALDWNRHR